jgi:hypothetical protein
MPSDCKRPMLRRGYGCGKSSYGCGKSKKAD